MFQSSPSTTPKSPLSIYQVKGWTRPGKSSGQTRSVSARARKCLRAQLPLRFLVHPCPLNTNAIPLHRTLTRLSVSYGANGPRSQALDYTVYDSLCWNCEGPLLCTPTPSQSCNVLSEPFGSGSDPFSNSPFNGGFSQSNIPLQLSPDSSGFGSGLHGGAAQVLHPELSGPCILNKDPGKKKSPSSLGP